MLLLAEGAATCKTLTDEKVFCPKASPSSSYLGLKKVAGGSKADEGTFLITAVRKAIRDLVFGHPTAGLPCACGVPPGHRRALLSSYLLFPEVLKK